MSSEQYTSNSRSSPQSSVLYTNLAVSGSQIRLLKILSTQPDVSCELEIIELNEQAEFNALSYVWGDPSNTESIYVNGNKVQVTTNLVSALRHTPPHLNDSRYAAGKRIWVDAICINQDDRAEKTHQVSMMGRIYSQSGIVLCWLGLPTDSIVAAIDAVETVAGKRFIHDTHMKNYKNHHELKTCIEELQSRLEKTKMVDPTKHLWVVEKLITKSSLIGDTEIYALADALQHTTNVIYRMLQRSYGIEVKHFRKDLLRTFHAIGGWHDRFRKCTAKLDASIIKSSHPIGFLLALLSFRIRKFRQIFQDYIQEILYDELNCNILWLKQYPWLQEVEEVVGEPRMGPAQPLFDLSYWSRMWVRQEVILAKHPVFACGSRAFSVETLELFSAWVGWILDPINSSITKKAGLSKLIMAYQRIWKLLHHIFDCRQTQGQSVGHWLSIRGLKPNIWCFSSDTRASNPKDYYYGFLALTNLEITPDYDSTKTLGLISREYVSEYLRAFRNKSFSNILSGGPLGLLVFAGVGYGWDMDPDMPSWGPNFPGQGQAKPSSRGCADAVFLESAEGFESIFRTESDATITGPDMEVSAIILDRIENIGPRVSDYGRPELLHPEGLPITWALDFALRHRRYVSGGHPLAALRTLLDPSAVPESAQIDPPVEDCLDFIKFLSRFNHPRPESKLPPSVSWKRRLCYVKELLAQVPDPVDDEGEDNYDKEISYIKTLGSKCKPYNHSIAETRKGYVGRFPPKIQKGDLICLLHGLDHVAVVRRRGEYFQFVGTCFIIGMRLSKQIQALVKLHSLEAEMATLR